ncbi:MAG: hypothetical protein AB7O24_15480 [Kofleriaceae bacterium]
MRVLLATLVLGACSFSNYQSARMLPRGGTNLTAAFTSYDYHEDGESPGEGAIEIMGSHGVSETVELGGKVSWFSPEGDDFFNLFVVPKMSLMPNKLAVSVPTGLLISGADDSETIWVTAPTLIFTQELHRNVDLDIAGKPYITIANDFDDAAMAFAFNLGVRLRIPDTAFSFMPEIGFMFDDDEPEGTDGGYYMQIGFGFSYDFLPASAALASQPIAPQPMGPPPPPPPPMAPMPPPPPPPEPAPATP